MNTSQLPKEQLVPSLMKSIESETLAVANVIAFLVAIEDQAAYADLGFSSMREFCQRHLQWSTAKASLRLAVAGLVREFPSILEAFASGRVTLSNLYLLRRAFTQENAEELISAAEGKTKNDITRMLKRRAPSLTATERLREMSRLPSQDGAHDATKKPSARRTPPAKTPTVDPPNESKTAAPGSGVGDAPRRYSFLATPPLQARIDRTCAWLGTTPSGDDITELVERAFAAWVETLERNDESVEARERGADADLGGADAGQNATREVLDPELSALPEALCKTPRAGWCASAPVREAPEHRPIERSARRSEESSSGAPRTNGAASRKRRATHAGV